MLPADVDLDPFDLLCPQPALQAKRCLKTMAAGQTRLLRCTDPLTEIEMPFLGQQQGLQLVQSQAQGGKFCFRIEVIQTRHNWLWIADNDSLPPCPREAV